MKSSILLADLKERTLENIKFAEKAKRLDVDALNWRVGSGTWNVLECLEHLCLYGDFYLPEIEQRMAKAKKGNYDHFRPGLMGDRFAKMMLPREKTNKMKTFKDKNPTGRVLEISVLDRFLNQQSKLLLLLQSADDVDLNKIKTVISISNWIKLKLGDTFRFVIYHNDRHVDQARRVLKLQPSKVDFVKFQ